MYAIVEIAGQQFKVAKDQKVFVHRLAANEGDVVTFNKVMLLDNGTLTIGAPVIDGAAVVVKILSHLKGDKVIVFKKKRRKGFRKKNGHRQFFTQILVEDIVASGFKGQKEEIKSKVTNVEVATEAIEAPVKDKKTSPNKKETDAVSEEKPKAAKKPAAKKTPKTEE